MISNYIIISVLLLITGFIFLYIDQYQRLSNKCKPTEKIIYRYIPRTPSEELEEEIFPSDIFKTMFTQPSPWINAVNDLDARQSKLVNKYFISQI
jgi:hypothetical protein